LLSLANGSLPSWTRFVASEYHSSRLLKHPHAKYNTLHKNLGNSTTPIASQATIHVDPFCTLGIKHQQNTIVKNLLCSGRMVLNARTQYRWKITFRSSITLWNVVCLSLVNWTIASVRDHDIQSRSNNGMWTNVPLSDMKQKDVLFVFWFSRFTSTKRSQRSLLWPSKNGFGTRAPKHVALRCQRAMLTTPTPSEVMVQQTTL
jgi:hypothetical protein